MDWKNIVRNIAPTIAAGLGGPMAGTAVKFLAEEFLGNPDATETEIQAAILGASPAELAKLRELDNQFAIEMAKLKVDIFKLEVDDRKSARDFAAATSIGPQLILSIIYTAGYLFVLNLFMTGDITIEDNVKSEFNLVLGALMVGQAQILNFWLGSSSGSKAKNDIFKK